MHSELPDQTSISFYLTARFISLLVEHLFTQERLDDLLTQWQPQSTPRLAEDCPVTPEDDARKEHIEGPDHTPQHHVTTMRYILVNRCDVTVGEDQSVTFKFDLSHHQKPCIIALNLTSHALSQFLSILHQKFVIADWSEHAWQTSKETARSGVSSDHKIIVH